MTAPLAALLHPFFLVVVVPVPDEEAVLDPEDEEVLLAEVLLVGELAAAFSLVEFISPPFRNSRASLSSFSAFQARNCERTSESSGDIVETLCVCGAGA